MTFFTWQFVNSQDRDGIHVFFFQRCTNHSHLHINDRITSSISHRNRMFTQSSKRRANIELAQTGLLEPGP